jgi:hypothetical protein
MRPRRVGPKSPVVSLVDLPAEFGADDATFALVELPVADAVSFIDVADIVPLPEAVLGEVMLGEELDVVEEETIASYVVEAKSTCGQDHWRLHDLAHL